MYGWRARLGFMVPPGAPTVEMEVPRLTPPGVSAHFTRMDASEGVGTQTGQEKRYRRQADSVENCARLLAMVRPAVIAMAHTATSYMIGSEREAQITANVERDTGCRFITAFGSSLVALAHLGVTRIGLATPYSEENTLRGKKHFEAHGIAVVRYAHLKDAPNVYDTTPEQAYRVGRSADGDDVEALFLSGVGMPTLAALQQLEDDIGKPVVSATAAMVWNALRIAEVDYRQQGYGSLFDRPVNVHGERPL
jgi:maleate cis-trans isomerase